MKNDYLSYVDYEYLAAEEDCAGVLVNKEGQALRIDGFDLFRGTRLRAMKYASEELLQWWADNPRLNMEQFENQWVQGRAEYQ